MKFVTFLHNGKERLGGLKDTDNATIVDITENFTSLHHVLKDGRLEQAQATVKAGQATINIDDVTLLPP